MPKLSPAYRNDDLGGLPSKTKDYLDTHYLQELSNMEKTNPKLVVVFSGGNAVGKSTLSQRINEELGGIVVENDAIKAHLLRYDPSISRDDLNALTWKYSQALYSRIGSMTSNGLLVRDGVIDWYYDRILPLFKEQGYALFIVAFDISREKQLELVKARGDKVTVSVERLMTIMADHAIHTKRFRGEYTPDVVLTDGGIFDHDQVIDKLRARILELSATK